MGIGLVQMLQFVISPEKSTWNASSLTDSSSLLAFDSVRRCHRRQSSDLDKAGQLRHEIIYETFAWCKPWKGL